MPRHDIRDGTVLTAVNNEMLSRTPNMPHPKLLTSLGNSSPKDNEKKQGIKDQTLNIENVAKCTTHYN